MTAAYMELSGNENREEVDRFSFRPCLSVHLLPPLRYWLFETALSGRALTVVPVFIYRNKTACSPAEESCPRSKFLLTQINSLGLLYGKLQDADLFAQSVHLQETGHRIYLFDRSFILYALFITGLHRTWPQSSPPC